MLDILVLRDTSHETQHLPLSKKASNQAKFTERRASESGQWGGLGAGSCRRQRRPPKINTKHTKYMENLNKTQENLTDTLPSFQEGTGVVLTPEEIKEAGLQQLQTSIKNIQRTIHDLTIIYGWMKEQLKDMANL